jgi:hypothetical protein
MDKQNKKLKDEILNILQDQIGGAMIKAPPSNKSDVVVPKSELIKLYEDNVRVSTGGQKDKPKDKPKAKPKAKAPKKPNRWIQHVRQYAKDNNVKYNVAIKEAKKTYVKDCPLKCVPKAKAPVKGSMAKAPAKLPAKTHVMPDGTIMKGEKHGGMYHGGQKEKAPVKPPAKKVKIIAAEEPAKPPPKVKSEEKLSADELFNDILDSFISYNKQFENISNSDRTLEDKKDDYDNLLDRINSYYDNISLRHLENPILSQSQRDKVEKAYNFLRDTYKIGYTSLVGGVPAERVDFEEFEEESQEQETIINALLDRQSNLVEANLAYPLLPEREHEAMQVVLPSIENNASAYPRASMPVVHSQVVHMIKTDKKQISDQDLADILHKVAVKYNPSISRTNIDEFIRFNKDPILDFLLDHMDKRGGNLLDPQEWVDSISNIATGTFDTLKTIGSVVGPFAALAGLFL